MVNFSFESSPILPAHVIPEGMPPGIENPPCFACMTALQEARDALTVARRRAEELFLAHKRAKDKGTESFQILMTFFDHLADTDKIHKDGMNAYNNVAVCGC